MDVDSDASAVGAFWVSFVFFFKSAVEATEPVLVGHVCFLALIVWVVKDVLHGVCCVSFAWTKC